MDGATSPNNKPYCIGVITRDSIRHVTTAMSKILLAHYPLNVVEVIALEGDIVLAQEMNISYPIFESNSLASVQSINAKKTNGSLGRHIFNGILNILPSFSS